MKKTCDNFMAEILSSSVALTPEAAAHLQECGECRRMRRTLLDAIPPEVPDFLKPGIMAAAEKAIAKRKFNRLFQRAALPFAAAVLIAVGITVYNQPAAEKPAMQIAAMTEQDWQEMEELCYGLDTDLHTFQYALADL